MHLFPRMPHYATRRGNRLRPARARRQVQEDGGDRHAPGHAQKLMPLRTNEPRATLNTRFFILANWIGHYYVGHILHFFIIGR